MREQDEDVGPVAAREGIYRRAARVAGGGADDRRAFAPFGQHVVHQPGEKLHGDVLERQRRPVEQFQQELVRAGLDQRADRLVTERRIGLVDEPSENGLVEVVLDEGAQQQLGRLGIGQAAQPPYVGMAEVRPLLGQVQAAVAGKPGEENVAEAECRGRATGAEISHREGIPSFRVGRAVEIAIEKPDSISRILAARLI